MPKFLFALLVGMAAALAACGRQVTPNPPNLGAGGANPGFMTIKFDVAAPFNFSTYRYWIVFNTSGSGISPLTNPQQNNWTAFSDAVLAGGANGATAAQAVQWRKSTTVVSSPYPLFLGTTPQQLEYLPNSNGTGTEFTITVSRSLFRNSTPSPYAKTWLFNAFVTQANAQGQMIFVDSMGVGGATDTTWVSPPLPICTNFNNPYYKNVDINPPSDPAAQIVSVEIANNGASLACPP
ncbi:MAG TPA: hypothetical protein VGG89_16015 [Candidatus Baltobacteraceae bacterium]